MKKNFKTLSVCLMCLCFCLTPVILGGCSNNDTNVESELKTQTTVEGIRYSFVDAVVENVETIIKGSGDNRYYYTTFTIEFDMGVQNKNDYDVTLATNAFRIKSNNDDLIFTCGEHENSTTYEPEVSGAYVSIAHSLDVLNFYGMTLELKSYSIGDFAYGKDYNEEKNLEKLKGTKFSVYLADTLLFEFKCR